ncbi:MAG: glycosyltransferase family 4 protein [Chloroflexota bacterium]
MKILMCNSFHYLRGGAERCFFELSAILEANGHTVVPFCMSDERNLASKYSDYFMSQIDFPTKLKEGGVKSKLEVMERVIYSREANRKVTELIEDTQPDIAHIHGIAHETSPSILPAIKRFGIPIVQTLHDYKLICPNTSFVSGNSVCEKCRGHRYYNVMLNRCKRGSLPASFLAAVEAYVHKGMQIYEKHVDHFISPSQFLKEKVESYGIQNPIVHLPNFINIDDFTPCYEPEDYFVFCGRLVPEKGIRTLVQAMKNINQSHLYIAGNGELEDDLKDFVRNNDIYNVTFLGHLPKEKLIPLIQKASFMVTPSEWYENNPMSVIEAFASGTPVVGANIGGIPELVQDNHTGMLFESGNQQQLEISILSLLSNRENLIRMGQNCRAHVETHNNPTTHYQQTLALYQRLLRQSQFQ